MNESQESQSLELSVRDFGPIASAEVDFRPLTVFVGPSNTGKSYLAMLVYALHRFFSISLVGIADLYRRQPGVSRIHRPATLLGQEKDLRGLYISDETVEELLELMRRVQVEISDTGYTTWDDIPRYSTQLPDSVATLVRTLIEEGSSNLGDAIVEELDRCFGIGRRRRLARWNSRAGAKVLIRRYPREHLHGGKLVEHELAVMSAHAQFKSSIPSDLPMYLVGLDYRAFFPTSWELPDVTYDEERRSLARYMIGDLIDHVMADTVGPLHRLAHYLPADRGGLMTTHKVIVNSLIGRSSLSATHLDEHSPTLPGVHADFLSQLITIETSRQRSSRGSELAERLESRLLKGTIHIRPSAAGFSDFYYVPDGWKEDIPLMNASSMVSELAPVVLYLRHVVGPNDVLIIEEPEAHLHPAMQVEFIRHLAAAVRAGVWIMLTTHSEWVLEELSNLVHLSSLTEFRRQGIGSADYALSQEEVGVWLFEPRQEPRGSIVREIAFDADNGGYVSDYEDVAIRTHNDWARISNRLTETDAE